MAILAFALLFVVAAVQSAEALGQLKILIDADNNPATGCSIATPAGPFDGAEWVVTSTINPATAQVVALAAQQCTGGALGAPIAVTSPFAPPWPVGVGVGLNGSDLVETYLAPFINVGGVIRVGFVYDNGVGVVSTLLTKTGAPGGPPILVTLGPAAIPTLGTWGLALLVILLLISGAILARRRGVRTSVWVTILALTAGIGLVWAAVTLDGQPGDWAGQSPIATGNGGGLQGAFFQQDNGINYFRVDGPFVCDPITVNPATLPGGGINQAYGPVNFTQTGGQGAITWSLTGTLPTGMSFSAAGVLSGTPTQAGSFPITVKATDARGCSGTRALTLDIAANAAPTANAQSVTTDEDTPKAITLGGSDPDSPGMTFNIASMPTNGTLGPAGGAACAPAGGGSNCTAGILYTPNANFAGADSFTFTVNDGTATSAPATVSITVNGINDVPSFTKGADQTVLEDAGPQTVNGWATNISAGPNEPGQTVDFIVSNNNNALFSAQPAVSPTGTLTFTPAANQNGTATVNVQIHDNGGTANGGVDTSAVQTFQITVTAVNDAPSFTKGPDQNVNEGAPAQTVNGWATAISAGPADEAGQVVDFIVTNDNNSLFSTQPAISPTGTLTYTPAANQSGLATVSVQIHDNGGTANGGVDTSAVQTFTITVTGVNNVPSFTKGPDQVVNEDAGPQTVNGWATAISPGTNEAGQTVDFIVSNNNNALFSVQPAIDATGTLTYTPAANQNGSATVTVQIHDNGGTANGGVDTSAAQTFTITVNAVNDAPVATSQTESTNEDVAKLITLTASDVDSTTLTPPPLTFTIVSPPAHGGVSVVIGDDPCTSTPPGVTCTAKVTYTPTPNFSGMDSFTFKANDGTNDSNVAIITISVGAQPDSPVANAQTTSTAEDTPKIITLSGVDPDGGTLTFAIVGGNPANGTLGPIGTPSCGAPDSNGAVTCTADVTYTPNANFASPPNDTFTFKVTNATGDSLPATVTVTVTNSNDPPVAADKPGETTNEDTAKVITLSATDVDSPTPPDLTFTVLTGPLNGNLSTNNPPATCINVVNGQSCTADVTYTPNLNFNGADSFTYKANDGSLDSNTATVSITVNAVADAPTAVGQSVTTDEEVDKVITLTGTDPDSASLTSFNIVAPGPANGSIISGPSAPSCVPVGSGTSCTSMVTYRPNVNYFGSDSFTFTVNDGALTSPPGTVNITVNGINDAPSFTKGADQTVLEDSGLATVNGWATAISAGPNEGGQTVDFIVSNDNNALFSTQPAVSPTGVLTFAPAPDKNGSATVSVQIHDNGGVANGGVDTSAVQTFVINVTPVNDAPSFTKGADQTVFEDSGLQTVNGWATNMSAGPADETGQLLNFIVSNNNNALFSVQPAIDASGNLTYTLAANQFGSATVSVQIHDNGGVANGGVDTSAVQTFVINVTGINDAPSFTKGADQTVNEDAGLVTVNGWATAISAGPNEGGQTVNFIVSNDNNGLFSVQPAVSATGVLTFTTAANRHGTATVTIQIHDNGGVANGGVDTSAAQTFTITINPVNDPPTAANQSYTAQSNMQISIPAGSGLLVGAADAADVAGNGAYVPTFTVGTVNGVGPVAGTITSTVAGVGTFVVTASTGAFTFEPAAGVTGAVSTTYTVCDNGDGPPASQCSAAAQINFTINGPVIWFVDPLSGSDVTNTGTLSSPFQTLTKVATVDASGHRIFVYNTATATGNIALNSNEWLIGQGVTAGGAVPFDTYFGITPPAGTIARPAINTTNSNVNSTVTFATSDKIDGLDMDGTSANLTNAGVTATSFIVNIGRFQRNSGAAATAINLSGAGNTGTFDFKSVSITGATGSSANKGVSISNLTGHFTVAGTDTALNPDGGTVSGYGGNGMEFISVANGGSTSVSLTNMTLSGNGQTQLVAGSNASCGGALITGNNLSCVSNLHLQTVNGVSLSNVSVTNSGQMGINGSNVTTLTIANSSITGNGNESFENGLTFQNLLGTCSITHTMMKDNAASQIVVANIANSSTLTLGITGTRTNNVYPTIDTSTTEIGKTTQTNTFTDQSLLINTVNTSTNVNITLNVTGVVFRNSIPGNSMHLNVNAGTGSSFSGTTTNTSFHNTAGGVIIQAQNDHDVTYNVTNSEFNRVNLQSILYAALNPYTGTMQGTVSGNHIGEDSTGTAGAACEPAAGSGCVGIDVNFIGGSGSISTRIENNVVQQFDNIGIRVVANGTGSPDVNANIVNNTIKSPLGLVAHGIDANIGTTASANVDGCLGMTGNNVSGTYEDPGAGTQFGITTRVRFDSTIRLPGFVGDPTDVGGPGNAVTDFIIGNNTTSSKVFTQRTAPGAYAGGAACATP